MEWIDVKRGYPLEYVPVVVITTKKYLIAIGAYDGEQWVGLPKQLGTPTHWLAIPDLPDNTIHIKSKKKKEIY